MSKPLSTYRRRKLEARSVTVLHKARALLSDLIGDLGVEHELTDLADNVVHEAEHLAHALRRDGPLTRRP
jgi:hypothetical protein